MGDVYKRQVGIVYIVYAFIRSSGIDIYIYLIMMIQLIGNIFYIEFVNEAAENYSFIAKKTILIRFGYLISIFIFVRKAEDIIPYTLVVSLTVFMNNFVSYLYCKKRLRFDFSEIRKLKYQIIPLIVTFLLTNVEILYTQLDKLMLSPVINDIAVTEYTLPTTLMSMVASLPVSYTHLDVYKRQPFPEGVRSWPQSIKKSSLPASFWRQAASSSARQVPMLPLWSIKRCLGERGTFLCKTPSTAVSYTHLDVYKRQPHRPGHA